MKRSCYHVLTYDYVTKAQPAGFVVERVDFYTRDGDTTVQERLRSAFLLLCSEALYTNYTVKSFRVIEERPPRYN